MVEFSIKELDGGFTLVEFVLPSGVINPEDLEAAVAAAPKVDPTKGVVISGRGPIWLAAGLAHHYHATPFVASFDPRLGGGVVVQSHNAAFRLGQIIPV